MDVSVVLPDAEKPTVDVQLPVQIVDISGL